MKARAINSIPSPIPKNVGKLIPASGRISPLGVGDITAI
jgi:hypothetical protein